MNILQVIKPLQPEPRHFIPVNDLRTILQAFQLLQGRPRSMAELAEANGCNIATTLDAVLRIRDAGFEITQTEDNPPRYFLAKPRKTPKPKATQRPFVRITLFRKWYGVAARKENWYVVRVDKPDARGTLVGPVRISGKSWRPRAEELAHSRNEAIKRQRAAVEKQLRESGVTEEEIQKYRQDGLELARKATGNPNYREEEI